MEGRTARPRVLFVDDDREYLLCCKLALEPLGYEVVIAEGGLASIDACREAGRPDLVFLDYNMPGMDGLQCLRLLEDFVVKFGAPIVFCSAKNDRKTITQALMRGARDYLVKPVELRDMVDCIEANLRAGTGSPRG